MALAAVIPIVIKGVTILSKGKAIFDKVEPAVKKLLGPLSSLLQIFGKREKLEEITGDVKQILASLQQSGFTTITYNELSAYKDEMKKRSGVSHHRTIWRVIRRDLGYFLQGDEKCLKKEPNLGNGQLPIYQYVVTDVPSNFKMPGQSGSNSSGTGTSKPNNLPPVPVKGAENSSFGLIILAGIGFLVYKLVKK